MEILAAKIENQMLALLVDKIPQTDELVFQRRNDLYFAEKDGYVEFYYYNKLDTAGAFHKTIKLKNGKIVKLNGAWSSRCGIMNKYFPHTIQVLITEIGDEFTNNPILGAYITVKLARQILNELLPEYKLRKRTLYGETEYEIVKR